MSGIQAVLFDYGGVLADEGFSNTLEALVKEQDLPVENMTAEGMQAIHYVDRVSFIKALNDMTGIKLV